MRAAKIKEHPSFPLMKQTDIQNVYHMQMPRWLFSDPRYAESRRQVREETWEHPGEGAQRAADYLLRKYEEITSGKEVG